MDRCKVILFAILAVFAASDAFSQVNGKYVPIPKDGVLDTLMFNDTTNILTAITTVGDTFQVIIPDSVGAPGGSADTIYQVDTVYSIDTVFSIDTLYQLDTIADINIYADDGTVDSFRTVSTAGNDLFFNTPNIDFKHSPTSASSLISFPGWSFEGGGGAMGFFTDGTGFFKAVSGTSSIEAKGSDITIQNGGGTILIDDAVNRTRINSADLELNNNDFPTGTPSTLGNGAGRYVWSVLQDGTTPLWTEETNYQQDLSDGGKVGVDQTIDITGGQSVTFSVADNDNATNNELNTNVNLNGTTLEITDAGGTLSQDLSSLASADGNIYDNSGTFSGNRTVGLNGHSLLIQESGSGVSLDMDGNGFLFDGGNNNTLTFGPSGANGNIIGYASDIRFNDAQIPPNLPLQSGTFYWTVDGISGGGAWANAPVSYSEGIGITFTGGNQINAGGDVSGGITWFGQGGSDDFITASGLNSFSMSANGGNNITVNSGGVILNGLTIPNTHNKAVQGIYYYNGNSFIPLDAPSSGTYILKSVNGSVQWVLE